MKTYFFTYGDNNFVNSKKRIFKEAHEIGFDNVKAYGPEDLSPEFTSKATPFINMPRGGGYWLWKAFFLKETLLKMNNNDICVYADAGCHVNIHGKNRLHEYYNIVSEDQSGSLAFHLGDLTEEMYCTERVFEHLEIPKDNTSIRKTSQLIATIFILRKCENTTNLVDQYYNLATTNSHLFSDIHNDYKRCNVFRDHRHDQSIFSILRKLNPTVILKDETYKGDNAPNWNLLKSIPILSTRIKG